MKCEFVVGQKVVCVKKGRWAALMDGPRDGANPIYGKVYEINGIESCGSFVFLDLVGYRDGYDAKRFRPLAEPDISVFETLLANINAGKVKPVVVPA